ncbi:MAG TPA: adenosylcobinamide-GDP ribazoletransferase [Acidimicrobiales bacterium]
MRRALAFLTIVGGAAPPDARSPAWFGPVGALLGLAVGGVWWAAGEAWGPLVAATLAVAADAVLTGGLHLDGVADTADGLLPPLDRDRRLAVMAQPDVGAFGVAALVLVLALRVAALAALAPEPLVVAGLWAGARAAMALTLAAVPYARPDGLASGFAALPAPPAPPPGTPAAGDPAAGGPGAGGPGSSEGGGSATPGPGETWRAGAAWRAIGAPAVGWGGGAALAVAGAGWLAGGAAALGLAAAFAGVVALARRRLGGYTGDVLGAAGVVAETVGLLLAAARW